ncbi:MAG: hypothetical protein JXQ90_22600 [Cyclobacteriaceae bacterium]
MLLFTITLIGAIALCESEKSSSDQRVISIQIGYVNVASLIKAALISLDGG